MERTFDRLVEFDERSRDYPIRALLDTTEPRSYTWRLDTILDQGREGACVGFAWAHEHAARPYVRPADAALALSIYREAQRVDEWPGEAYQGTSVLAGAKVVKARGHLSEYRWAFNLTDTLATISRRGPVVLGINWYAGMYHPDPDGRVHVAGHLAGGHAILATGVNVKRQTVTLANSWGTDWGINGKGYITWGGLSRLLSEDGEVCVPVVRG